MSNQISLTIPNDDPIALRAFGNALEEMAVAHGAEVRKPVIISQKHAIGDMSVETVMQGITEPLRPYQQAVIDTGAEAPIADDTTDDDDVALPAQPSSNLDADGLPWDARIHSGNQERNADNTWRARRKPKDVTPEQWAEQVAQVRDELFALMAIPVATSDYSADAPAAHEVMTNELGHDPAVAGGDYSVEVPVTSDGLNDLPETHLNGMVCSVCHELQYDSPYGTTCKNGHGGVEGAEPFEISNDSPAAVFGAVPPAPEPLPVVTVADPVPPAPAPLPPVVAADPVPPAPAPLPPVAATGAIPTTMADFMTSLTKYGPKDPSNKDECAVHVARVNEIVARHGLVSVGQLAKRLDLIPQVYADLVKELGQ